MNPLHPWQLQSSVCELQAKVRLFLSVYAASNYARTNVYVSAFVFVLASGLCVWAVMNNANRGCSCCWWPGEKQCTVKRVA